MTMNILVLGATGYVGQRLVARLAASGWATPIAGSRRPGGAVGIEQRQVDTLDPASIGAALKGVDAVVNCVAGSPAAIADGARLLTDAALAADKPRIVHFSSMAAYGSQQGVLTESTPLDGDLGWYAKAKGESELHMRRYAEAGHPVVMFRPGCVYGAGSEMWVGRPARLLKQGRLGDLGEGGDGWSNLVHVDDVCAAVLGALRYRTPAGAPAVFNLSAPDSPRWNRYFADLALAIGATPLRRLSMRQVRMDALLAGPAIKIAELVLRKARRPVAWLPVPIARSLLSLWAQQIRLDSTAAQRELGFNWLPYEAGVADSARWVVSRHAQA